jgi:hypothetical protein
MLAAQPTRPASVASEIREEIREIERSIAIADLYFEAMAPFPSFETMSEEELRGWLTGH